MYRVIVLQKEQDAIKVFAGDLYGERGDCKLVVTKDGVTREFPKSDVFGVFVFAHTRICLANSSAYNMRLAYKTRELAEYAGKQFLNIWADFVFKSQDYE